MADWRPQDEDMDGGLVLQSAIYGLRFVEHVCDQRIKDISAIETTLGNPREGNLRMAASLQMSLESGGIATVIANYLNQPATGAWGFEELRVFGTEGYLLTNFIDASVTVCIGDVKETYQPEPEEGLLSIIIRTIAEGGSIPDLMRPTRFALRARENIVLS